MANYILNWKSGLGNVTLSPTSSISIPKQDGSGNIDFVVLKYDEDGQPVYLLDDDGYKVPKGDQPYSTTAAGDSISIEGFPPGSLPDGVFSYALNLTTIRLGAGSDRLRLFGKGIVQTARTDVSLDSAAGYVFQSNIFAEGGDDYISPLMPWQSVFKGGANTPYDNLVLSDSLTLEEVPYGDTIQLKGSRADWDLEFKDGNGDGDVSLASILDERDYIATSNNNRISGFERLFFSDVILELVLYKQLASNAIYGQPEYFLFGNEVAPSLNSSIKGDLWEAFRFSRTRMGGAQGTAAAPITIRTGPAADTPTFGIDKDQALMAGPNGGPAIQYVNLYTEDANDILELGNIENSIVDTGSGEDAINLRGTARYTRFYGGSGSADTLTLPKDKKSYVFSVSTDSATGKPYFRDVNSNEYRDIELYIFSDLTITAAELLSLLTVAPEPPVIGPNIGGDTITTPNPLTPELWVQGSYDNQVYRGIAGTEVRRMVVSTGDANNRINLSDAIAFADVQTGNGDDVVRVDVYESRDKPFVQQGRAVYRSTINTGAGRDIVNAQSIGNSGAYVVDDPLLGPEYQIPDYYQSSIDLGTDDDFIYAFLPYASTFKGGAGVDEILLYGTRSDWDFEFQYKGDGSLDYIVAGGVRGYNVADQNRIYSDFEYIQFNDIRANLANPPVDASADALGQDLLIRTLPELNSTVTVGLWDALAFNRLSIQAVRGTAARRVNIQTGAGADTPVIGLDSQGKVLTQAGGLPSVQYADISTGADNDVVKIASIDQSSIDLGEGNNVVEIRGAISNTDILGGGGKNTLLLPLSKNEYGLYLDGAVIRDKSGNAYRGFTDQSEVSFNGDKTLVGDLKKQLPGKDDIQPVPQDGFISRIGWKGNLTDKNASEASGNATIYKIDNEKAVKKIYNEYGVLVEVPDVSVSATGGYGYWLGRLVASEGADEVNVKAFGHVAPTYSGGFKPTYSYPDYYKAIVETKGGDDKIFGYFPYASSFDGGAGWDSILLYGKRVDFKFALKNENGVDIISDSNGNTYKNIEFFQFGDQDIAFNDLKEQLVVSPGLPNGSPPYDPPYISRVGWKQNITSADALQATGKENVFRVDNERAVKKVFNESGILVDIPDVSVSETGGYGYSLGVLAGSGSDDIIDAKAFGHLAPTYSNGFKPTYAYPDYYKAIIQANAGNDKIFGYFPYASSFDGGAGWDSILLYGKREDFKLSFKVVDGVDVIFDANGNTYKNIESFQFGDQDITFDDLKKQLATNPDLPNGGGSSEDLFASVVSAFQTPLDATMLVIGSKYSLSEIRDYDGVLHGGASKSVDGDYGFQGFVDVQGDGRKEAVYTNQKSARFVTARVDSFTGQISYADYGRNGSTRVVGRYIDPLVAEGEAHGGFLLSGEKAPQRGGPHDSQTRFTEDLRRGNLILKAAKDFDGDGFQEVYWKLKDGSAYMRGLMHKDGNIQYVNYQSEAQMTDYLTRTGNSALLNYIVY